MFIVKYQSLTFRKMADHFPGKKKTFPKARDMIVVIWG